MLRLINTEVNIYLLHPETGTPHLVQVLTEDENHRVLETFPVDWRDVKREAVEAFDEILSLSLESFQKDYSRKTSVFIYQGSKD